MTKVKVTIDNKTVEVNPGATVLEAAEKADVEIPTLCHDPRLEPFAACRLCFVEIEGGNKPMTACSTEARDGMEVHTNSETLSEIRKSALELLLANHYGDCMAPCNQACPASVDVQGFIAHIANGKPREAASVVREQMPFPSSVGRVCPKFCEEKCRRDILEDPVSICTLHRFAGDQDLAAKGDNLPEVKPDTGKHVAVVGGGPAGLSAAYYLRQEGHRVTIFEGEEKLGGFLRYGIPEYRLPNDLLDQEIDHILKLGIQVKTNKRLGEDFTVDSLKESEYDAVFLAIGAQENRDLDLGCPSDLSGFYSGIDYLKNIAEGKHVELGKKVVVVGGGNTAMDAARTSVRMGADVTVVYRRSRNEMPADPKEIEEALEEGVDIQFLTNPSQVIGEDKVEEVECVQMELGPPDESGRRRPQPIEGSEFRLQADSVILAVGQEVDDDCFADCEALCATSWGEVDASEETFTTTAEGVFAAGDCVTGPSTVVEAIGQAKKATFSIDKYLNGEEITPIKEEYNCSRGENEDIDPEEYADEESQERTEQPTIEPEKRKTSFVEYEHGFDELSARKETKRCLSCGCDEVFDCTLKELATEYGVSDDEVVKMDRKQNHPIPEDHPYIKRDPNKCILCGSCVRICSEVQGVHAFGMVNRGLDTIVLPSLEMPLEETECESCSQCISVCPTGALTNRLALEKPGPWKTDKKDSVCPHCGVGCSITLEHAGDQLVGVESRVNNEVNAGNLCVEGAYRYNTLDQHENNEMAENDQEEALKKAAHELARVKKEGSLAVFISPKLPLEIAKQTKQLAHGKLGADYIASTTPINYSILKQSKEELMAEYGGEFNDLDHSDFIVMYRVNPGEDYPVVDNRVRMNKNKGTQLALINDVKTKLDDIVDNYVAVDSSKKGQETLTSLANGAGQDEVAKSLQQAKSPVIILDGARITEQELQAVTEVANKHQGDLKVLVLQPAGNSYGFVQEDILTHEHEEVMNKVAAGDITGALVIESDEELATKLSNNGKSLFVADILAGRVAGNGAADVTMMAESYLEMDGSFYNSEGRLQKMSAVNKKPVVTELLEKLQQSM
ncbi:FAD-dependent oxidoreductase [Natranaerobius thermophilus]|uniref:Molybdopterin oxidoreductase Fe4S4 region n=1 Tax=Natranaerobius thermophilus (strain ATCC BAA-1301 / DSM 18059 / JW/NM-WN-LF) TaxID=457570 RepID=B2A227_NATTJ|nr:FAD-dependent oxidoreductase [Natranaerobius thermophilus]ACB84832.1 molybdopterin oxidoreductase Fe4S4 region [Natranaerobius thermophilus JW/NM-WN-LF]